MKPRGLIPLGMLFVSGIALEKGYTLIAIALIFVAIADTIGYIVLKHFVDQEDQE